MGAGLIGGILGAVGSLGKIGVGIAQNSEANKIDPVYKPYEVSQYAQNQLGTAQQLFNGRMAGAADQERNIATSQADSFANAARGATDSGQLLQMGAAGQGMANNAYQQLQIAEKQNKYDLLGNLNAGYQAMTAEGDKVYQDQLNKFNIDSQQKAALRSSAWGNIFGGANDLASTAVQGDQLGWFNGGSGSGGTTAAPHEAGGSTRGLVH